MAKNQTSFFATQNDILLVLNELKSNFTYVLSCQEKCGKISICESPEDVEDLGIMFGEDQSQSNLFLLINPNDEPRTRAIAQRNGDIKNFYDQISHPKSVLLRAGGLRNDSFCIIAGQAGTVSDDAWSVALYKAILTIIKRRFTKIKSFYVGDEAIEKLDMGYRLTTNIRSPVDYDLVR